MSDASDTGFAELTAKISRDRGFGCASYKDKCLRRRIAVRMRARGVHTYPDYARVLDSDAAEYDKLLDALTINVTKLFRNWETYSAIAERAGALGELGTRVRVLGTDIDARSLAAARAGEFTEADFGDTPPELRRRYFAPVAPFTVASELKRLVHFERRDLLADAPPAGPHHLVCCRNVLIYFDRQTQERLFEKFHQALAPDGFLVLGKVETLLGAARSRFVAVDGRERIFRPI